ncbi:MSHA biogenesis protein MshD [Vibrio breoganii]|uniref:type IV pilus modification PilV family protein n=2 Tax=Vibrio TaxID=662 RepID=UPI000C85B78A|nr:prepilin-type N-terminal cleavage/methylation domain-containing protein [Vibrio breoganii]PMJ45728.1 MSHA biogenesis protein MshD [Vibrio breoganii]PMK49784.1 MSHA biogenesis protein MshD [Vibrio breoganii]PMK56472.1 MSHA biogenesis protein MshD [Vibrio breoganii]PMK79822.1 MSHA biogenesis protein MshD [Vibrio breoganii]PMO25612.1 MSHA biogenesis protein MshD [Vibrio breoganii]
MAVKKSAGFTLIESIIAIVILGIALITLTSFLFPQIAQSAKPFYEVRASALANSLMTEILSRNFDENSDHNGGYYRCGESDYIDDDGKIITCTTELGPDGNEVDSDGKRFPEFFNDVDDYIGCWYSTPQSQTACRLDEAGSLTDIFGNDIADDYLGFRAEVEVVYDNDTRLGVTDKDLFKRVTVTITASQYGDFKFSAYRGNY